MTDIIIHRKNDVHIIIESDESIAYELEEFFCFFVPGYRFMPKYKNKMWDGKIRLFSIWTRELYLGLTKYVIEFAKSREYTISIDDNVQSKVDISPKQVLDLCNKLNIHSGGTKITPHDYQLVAIWHALTKKRSILLSPTSSGKSLIIYVIIRALSALIKRDKKILIVVPTVSLVSQMYSDFGDYSSEIEWNVENNVHKITGGMEKNTDKKVVISTWQSIFKQPKKWFEQFDALIVDECHLATAKSLTGIAEKMINCSYKIGTTGTLEDSKTSKLVLEGLLGPVKPIITTAELMERKTVAKLQINSLVLVYPDEDKQLCRKATYKAEMDFLFAHHHRNFFIARLAKAQKKNTLLLFNTIEHGRLLEKVIKEMCPDRNVYFVDGSVDADRREEIRSLMERDTDCITIASYGVFSTGVSVKNIHSMIFCSPTKSKIRTLQSVGRGLRVNKTKDSVKLFDIVDDLSWKRNKNYALKHYLERADYYAKEKFEIISARITLVPGT